MFCLPSSPSLSFRRCSRSIPAQVPITGSDVKLNPTPLGYTVSLLNSYLVPVLALYWWFSRRCPEGDGAIRRKIRRVVLGRQLAPPREYQLDYRRSVYRWTLLTLIPLGFLLDIVLGHEFLKFDNREATLTIIPLFRAFDFTTGQFVSPHTGRGVRVLHARLHGDSVGIRLVRRGTGPIAQRARLRGSAERHAWGPPPFIAAIEIRQILYTTDRFNSAGVSGVCVQAVARSAVRPRWFSLPTSRFSSSRRSFRAILLFRATERFINWQAVSLTMFWVATYQHLLELKRARPVWMVGLPDERHMMGLFVGAWFGLPIEAVILWLSVTFTTVMVYETYKILICIRTGVCGVSWKTALFGSSTLWGLGQTTSSSPTTAASGAEDPERALAEQRRRISGNRS